MHYTFVYRVSNGILPRWYILKFDLYIQYVRVMWVIISQLISVSWVEPA